MARSGADTDRLICLGAKTMQTGPGDQGDQGTSMLGVQGLDYEQATCMPKRDRIGERRHGRAV